MPCSAWSVDSAWEASFSCTKTTQRCNVARQKSGASRLGSARSAQMLCGRSWLCSENLCAEAWERASRWLLKSASMLWGSDNKHRKFENGGFQVKLLEPAVNLYAVIKAAVFGIATSNLACTHRASSNPPSVYLCPPCVCYQAHSYSYTPEDTLINTFYIYYFISAAPSRSVILLKGPL